MEYIKEGFTLPVPINIMPTSEAVIEFVKNIRERVKRGEILTPKSNNVVVYDEPGSNYELKSQVSGINFNFNSAEIPHKFQNTAENAPNFNKV